MTNNPTGSAHVFALMDAALQSETGVTVRGLEKGKAIYLRGMIHSARNTDRVRSKKQYQEDTNDPRYGRSPYDPLVTELQPQPDGTYHLRVLKSDVLAHELDVVKDGTDTKVNLSDYL